MLCTNEDSLVLATSTPFALSPEPAEGPVLSPSKDRRVNGRFLKEALRSAEMVNPGPYLVKAKGVKLRRVKDLWRADDRRDIGIEYGA
jgi:hypothetical protein